MKGRRSPMRLPVVLLGALLLVANGIALAFFTWPRLTRVRRAESRALEVAARRAELEALWSRVTERKNVLARNRQDIEILYRDHLKARADDLFQAQREIDTLAREAGLRPKQSTYSMATIRGTDLVRCEVSLPLDGSYANLTGFLDRIETTKRFIVVDQMGLTRDEGGARMNLKLSAIFKEGGARATP
jgi:Tfp pilus assembly protein PilO